MKRFSMPLVLALAALSVLAAGTPAHAGERAFKASGEGTVDDIDRLQGLGQATHLGRSVLRLRLDATDLFNGNSIPGYGSLSSASGEVLYFHVMDPYYFDPATGVVIATLTFTGGSGRFQDATGSADVMFVFDVYLQHFVFLIDGSIDY